VEPVRRPLDRTLPGGAHLVQWVITCRPSETSWTRAAADVQEMRQVLSVAALCVAPRDDRRRGAAPVQKVSSRIESRNTVEQLVCRVGLLRLTRRVGN
jgi:hypothetical protein